jgi:mannose-6-phosphate isomerase
VTLCPARLEPIFSPRPWGSRSLAPFFPEKSKLAEPIGETWLTGNECVFANGPFAGKKLCEAWPQMAEDWRGSAVPAGKTFPILTKFIFSEEKLSVQVHPDDGYAAKHEAAAGGMGKTEMWYTVRARPGAEVLAGLKPSVTSDSFRKAIADGTAEDCLEPVPLAEGEAIFIPARTAHTIGPGLVLCEVQQHSDLTYRVFDYNRRDAQGRARELHIEKALAVMRFGKQDCARLDPVRVDRGAAKESLFVICRYFATEKWELGEPIARATSPEHFDLLIVLDGSGEIVWPGGSASYAKAQAWLLPAALGTYQLRPASYTSLLRTFAPGEKMDFNKYFVEHGVTRAVGERLIRG